MWTSRGRRSRVSRVCVAVCPGPASCVLVNRAISKKLTRDSALGGPCTAATLYAHVPRCMHKPRSGSECRVVGRTYSLLTRRKHPQQILLHRAIAMVRKRFIPG